MLSGFAAARQIKQHEPDTFILFFSIHDTNEILEEARSAGNGFILQDKIVEMPLKAVDALFHRQSFFPPVDRSEEI